MDYIKLNDRIKVPILGSGTFMISPEDTEKAIYEALKRSYGEVL